MREFYTNITVKGPKQEDVVAYLRQEGRNAYVSPTVGRRTAVADEQCETQNIHVLSRVTAGLARRFNCPAVAVLVHDGLVLSYILYDGNNLVDVYDSSPNYLVPEKGPVPPSGGKPQVLCELFGVPQAVKTVDEILRSNPLRDPRYRYAIDRHAALADALGIPNFVIGVGYNYLQAKGTQTPGGQGEWVHVLSTTRLEPVAPKRRLLGRFLGEKDHRTEHTLA